MPQKRRVAVAKTAICRSRQIMQPPMPGPARFAAFLVVRFALAALLAAVAPHPGVAQQNFSALNPWVLACDKSNKCQIRNEIVRGGAAVSHLRLYRLGEAEIFEFRIPLGIDIRKGVAYRIDRRGTSISKAPRACCADSSERRTFPDSGVTLFREGSPPPAPCSSTSRIPRRRRCHISRRSACSCATMP